MSTTTAPGVRPTAAAHILERLRPLHQRLYPLVTELAADGVPVAVTCRALKLSRQPCYRWPANPITDAELIAAYRANALFDAHHDDPEFGYRFLLDEARDAGEVMAERTAWRICRDNGWWSAFGKRRRGKGRRPGPPVHDDLVRREFTADAPNRLWLSDITEHKTGEGKLYLCAIKDVFSNRIVGYSISDRMKARLAVDAVNSAVARRGNVAGCVVHTDRGSQFRARKMVRALHHHGMVGSMGRVGAAGDNAAMEMLLSVSSGRGVGFEESEEVSRVVPLEAAHRLPFRLAFGDPSSEILACLGVNLRAGEDHGVKRPVQLAVAAA